MLAMRRMNGWLALAVVAACGLDAQIMGPPGTGYPGGRYPGTGYPGGGYPGGGISLPGRGKKQKTQDAQSPDKLIHYAGALQDISDNSLSVRLEDSRTIEFKRTTKTKFFKETGSASASAFHVGDRVTVEATQDERAYYTAVNVRLEKEAGKSESGSATEVSTDVPDSAKVGDPNRPVLRRGIPAKKPQIEAAEETAPSAPSEPQQTAEATGRPSLRLDAKGSEPVAQVVKRFNDPFLDKAYDAAVSFTEALPNYVCQEYVARYQSDTRVPNWRAMDVVSYDLVYQDGREDYRNPKINGKPVASGEDQKSGSWSSGEFGTILRGLFSLGPAGNFHLTKETTIVHRTARVYEFSVPKNLSRWHVVSGSQAIDPGYKGSVWIDKENARVLRIEMQAVSLPQDYPLDTVESSVDYDYIRLDAARQFLLPVKAETLSCERGSFNCSRNSMDFRNYHKFAGEATITFDK